MAQRPTPIAPAARASRPGNQAGLIRRPGCYWPWAAALASGVVLALAYPPVEWHWLAWLGLAPVLWLALRQGANGLSLGYAFGLGFFTTSCYWLKEIFVLIPLGLALIVALYPALWLGLALGLWQALWRGPKVDLLPQSDPRVPPPPLPGPLRQCLWLLLVAAAWAALEWARGWVLSGFPWNLLGTSQWANSWLLPLTRLTGITGISFLMAAVGSAVGLAVWLWPRQRGLPWVQRLPWPLILALALVLLAGLARRELPAPDRTVRIGMCQGNIPQIRRYTQAQLQDALETYLRLTWDLEAQRPPPELIIWPETAIPAPLTQIMNQLPGIFRAFTVPLLAGSVETRGPPGATLEQTRDFNTALLIRDGAVRDWYDKRHLVPFGEYVPGSRWLPVLQDWFGMGRDLTPGAEYTVLEPVPGLRLGINICFEDVFPEISGEQVQRGAQLLVLISNDAWYNETAGSAQHLRQAVFRAVEHGRPVLRGGNNSDTCLILPDGQVRELLVDPASGSPFYRGSRIYEVPIWDTAPLTFYTRHGDRFAHGCAVLAVLTALYLLARALDRRRRRRALMAPPPPPGALQP